MALPFLAKERLARILTGQRNLQRNRTIVNTWLKRALAAALVASAALVGFGVFVERWYHAPLPVVATEEAELAPGQPFSRFAAHLAERGLITHPRLWTWRARLAGAARQVQAGEYEVRPGDTPATLLERLRQGDVKTYEVKLIEGWTVRDALRALAADPALEHTLAGVDEQTLLEQLGLPGGHAEGMFFPDTYHFVRGATDADVLRRAYLKLESELSRLWNDRAPELPYETPYEALIVASLIEKETGVESDRARISQVFASRLDLGMRLQTDPSVIYGLGAAFDGDLKRRDLRTDGPYNTYTRSGLPPTPIALAGGRSLEAALHPASGDFLYFVSKGDGSSEFSVSLEEHEAAVRKYQLR